MPDLETKRGATSTLCEVKTINTSEEELERRRSGGVMNVTNSLDSAFLQKLASTLATAQVQLAAVDGPALKLIYVIINFDEYFHEYEQEYRIDIDNYMASNPLPDDVRVYFDIRLAFG